ncbi:MAG: glycosyltransferase, partial [Tenuifilaceae bacterium]|nr:glycosyltransferase [Tenuifilaceae bacterium]
LIDREAPLTAQVVMYLRFISKLGGVETFVYEWIKRFHKEHDILFLYDEADPQQLLRLRQMVKCQIYKGEKVECETYLNVNFNKNIADNVKAKLYLDMCHTDYDAMGWQYTTHPKTDITLCVSKVVEKALKKQYPKLKTEVVPNLLEQPKPKRTLFLVSATRLSWEKGYWRMKEFAKRLNERKIPFTWLVFTNDLPDEEIDGFVFMKPRLNVLDFVARADYLVQLSNTEADPYSPKEALSVGTPIITTNYPSTYETGMEVGKNGYVLDMELENLDEVIENMYKHTLKPKPMTNDYDTAWLKHLGKKTKSSYKYDKNEKIEDILEDIWIAKRRLKDDEGKIVKKGEVAKLYSSQRIRQLLEYNMIERKVT